MARILRALMILGIIVEMGLGANKTEPGHPEDTFGKPLPEVARLGKGPSMDTAVDGDFLYVIGEGNLHIASLEDPAHPRLLSHLGGLGNTRQIEVEGGVAYITSREDGLFLVDIKDPTQPKILCHYDTIELATGIAVSRPARDGSRPGAACVAYVACRTYGVELIDVTDARQARHLSTVRTGEAQSIVVRDGLLYAGVWGTKELVLCDVKDPRKPRILSKAPLDGYGDGVDVRGKYCFVATGHHARGIKKDDPSDPAFGNGHGLEVFDVSDPLKPAFVSRIKMPRLYSLGNDMWDVEVAGDVAFIGDTFNGVFEVDVSDPRQMRFIAHRQLDYLASRKQFDFVGGFALGKGHLYVAGGYSDLHVLRSEQAHPVSREKGESPLLSAAPERVEPDFLAYHPDGQVYAAALHGNLVFVAAGKAGLHVLELTQGAGAGQGALQFRKIAELPTEGFAVDVKVSKSLIYVAESKGGLKISRWEDGTLKAIGIYRDEKLPVKQVVVPKGGKYALLHVGGAFLQVLDISAPEQPKPVLRDSRLGLLYGYQITEGLFEDRWALCFWHVSGLHWYDLGGENPAYAGNFGRRMNPADGAAFIKEGALVISSGKYLVMRPGEKASNENPKFIEVPGHPLSGKPRVFGNTLYVSDRFEGKVHLVDIADLAKPRFLRTIDLEGNPGLVLEHRGKLLIPAGYQGLLLEK